MPCPGGLVIIITRNVTDSLGSATLFQFNGCEAGYTAQRLDSTWYVYFADAADAPQPPQAVVLTVSPRSVPAPLTRNGAAHLRLACTCIEHLTWQECIRRYDRPHTLFYMDASYWQTESYSIGFGIEHYEEMAATLGNLKGKSIISLNAQPEIRRIFAGYHIRPPTSATPSAAARDQMPARC